MRAPLLAAGCDLDLDARAVGTLASAWGNWSRAKGGPSIGPGSSAAAIKSAAAPKLFRTADDPRTAVPSLKMRNGESEMATSALATPKISSAPRPGRRSGLDRGRGPAASLLAAPKRAVLGSGHAAGDVAGRADVAWVTSRRAAPAVDDCDPDWGPPWLQQQLKQ